MPRRSPFSEEEKKSNKNLPSWIGPKERRLILQRQRLDNQIARTTGRQSPFSDEELGKKGGGGGGLLNRAFDVLSRPQYAVASAAQGFWKKDGRGGVIGSLMDAATGAKKGLEGKRKTSFSQVLEEEAGIKNRFITGVGGLALDILADPTTYATLGTSGAAKGVGKVAVEAATTGSRTQRAANALKAAKEIGALDEAGKVARGAKRAEVFASTGKAPAKGTLEKLTREVKKQETERILNAASKEIAGPEASKIQLRFGGRTIAESELAYRALSAPGRALAQTEVGQRLGQLFSTKNIYGPLAPAVRMFQGRSIAEFEDFKARPFLNNGREYTWDRLPLSKKESEEFAMAREEGLIHTLAPSKNSIDWDELNEEFNKLADNVYAHDEALGLLSPDKSPKIPNYVRHDYKVNKRAKVEAAKAHRRAIASDIYKPAMERKIPTLRQAKEAGLNPETDIRVIAMNMASNSFTSAARVNVIDDAIQNFGFTIDKATATTLRKNGHDVVNLKTELSKGMNKNEKEKLLSFIDDDVYMSREVAQFLGAVDRKLNLPDEIESIFRLIDKVTVPWKALATIYNPGHHMRNMSTDVFLNYMDEVVSPRPYNIARKLLFSKHSTEGLTTLKGQRHAISNAILLREFKESGAAPGWIITHVDEGGKVLKGKLSRLAHEASGKREEYGRLAHWLDALEKEGKGKNFRNLEELQKASRKAAERVRHWNIDYTDLTPFERTVMKRLVPFYTWMRHSTPLILEAMATKPGRVAAVPKSLNAFEQLAGIDPEDKLPVDLIPQWIKEAGGIQVGSSGENPVFMGPFFFPGTETAKQLEPLLPSQLGGKPSLVEGLREFASQTNPLLRAAYELPAGRTLYGNVPIKSTLEYALNQIPFSRNLSAIQRDVNDPDKNDIRTRLLNYLTGTSLYEITPNRIRGELHRQIDPRQEYLRKVRKGRER